MARKTWNLQDHDNMVLDRLVSRSGYQQILPVEVDQLFDTEECAYIYEDGSALIHDSYNNWRIKTNYGRSVYHQDY